MKDILCKLFGFFKYILFIAAFGLVFYGIMVTYGRLEKPLTDAVDVFIPFGIVLVLFIITLIVKSKYVGSSLLFNFVAVLVFILTIVVCLRSMYDTNMILYHRYGIKFNPAYFSDNLSAIQSMLYMLAGANALLLVCDFINKKKKKALVNEVATESVKVKEEKVTLDEDTEDEKEKSNKKRKALKKTVKK